MGSIWGFSWAERVRESAISKIGVRNFAILLFMFVTSSFKRRLGFSIDVEPAMGNDGGADEAHSGTHGEFDGGSSSPILLYMA